MTKTSPPTIVAEQVAIELVNPVLLLPVSLIDKKLYLVRQEHLFNYVAW